MDDDFIDQVRFHLPVSVGMRFGVIPDGMHGARQIPPERINISADVFMRGTIHSITSPTHPTLVLLGSEALGDAGPVQRQKTHYRSGDFLAEDFVLSVKADGLDAARCFAERGPTGTVAMQLTMVPQIKLTPIPAQEYIFLVDRSGSMRGQRIEKARSALVMLLRALPRKGTMFNIFSFGTTCTSLWGESMEYTSGTLAEVVRLWSPYRHSSIMSLTPSKDAAR